MPDVSSHLRTDHKAVDKRDPLRSVAGWLAGDSKKVPIVLDDERPFGVINERGLMARQLDDKAKIERYTVPTRALPERASLEDARARLGQLRVAYMPVEDARGKLAGYVRALDVARESSAVAQAAQVAVPTLLLREDATMGDAVNAFAKEYVDFLPVVGKDGRVAGVLPRRAVLRMELQAGDKGRKDAGGEKFSMLRDRVAGLMDEAPAFLPARATLDDVLETLDDAGYAIVNGAGGDMLGIVTPETLFQ